MPVIPNNYPAGCSNQDIIRIVGELSQEMISGGANINDVLRFVPLINVGQAELQNRVLTANNLTTSNLHNEVGLLRRITQQYGKSSDKFSTSSRRISITAILIALLSLLVSIVLFYESGQSSQNWQAQQIRILKQIQLNTSK